MALSIDQINAVSHPYFEDFIKQQIYEETPILDRLRKKNRVQFSGGTKLHVPIRYTELGDAEMIDPDAARVTVHYETRTAIELDWKFAKCDIVMLWKEAVYNGEEGRIADLLADKAKEGVQDLSKLISLQFCQAYSQKGDLDMDGFFSCVRDPSSDTTYGGISSADAPSWKAGLYDTTTTTLALYGSGSLEAGMRACFFRGYPDLMLTTLELAGIYASKLQPSERREPENGRAGATDIYFMGSPIVVDTHLPAGTWAFLHTDDLWFYMHKGDSIQVGKWESDPDRYKAMRALITCVGNFAFTTRKRFGAYTALTS